MLINLNKPNDPDFSNNFQLTRKHKLSYNSILTSIHGVAVDSK